MRQVIIAAFAATSLFPFVASGEQKAVHPARIDLRAYKPLQGFSHRVGERHFVGYFVSSEDHCAVTVLDATVDHGRSFDMPRRYKFVLAAGDRFEIKADHGKALGIGCSADAGEIAVVTLEPNLPASANQ